MIMKNVKSCQGFTLVEMLVTIIILFILFIALFPITQSIIKTTFIETPSYTGKEEA
ncbi:MAG TPA: prepilin-type N-terminal cleavage/methylation domain-containing protein, partial [Pyrodictiaceae archaeon]|nr:prepilin-type N-terminal cleavage/methylation domain-containing protein [Pyrodictiaceae archaeon]